ncbi:hypothetical protein R5R35_011576 [Gryllus longicercus]|uniref:Sulfotransferase domain-containing protein n=1 Tax=Gryllus longicercus TaxID=2509291 RepID=A0AAN9V7B4_9ORTH
MSVTLEDYSSPWAEKINANCKNKDFYLATLKAYPSGCVVTEGYRPLAEGIANFDVREDDIWVVTYPKCGTTWTQEMVWLIANNCDFEGARKVLLNERFPFIEFGMITADTGIEGDTFATAKNMQPPRFIKSHLPKGLLPKELWTKKPKIVYVSRDPKDVALSFYHHYKLMNGYKGSVEDYLEAFMNDALVYSPFWGHILDFWKLRHEPNVLFNTYEEMKQDLPSVIRRTARFLGRSLTEEQVAALTDHLSFAKMRENYSVNKEEGMTILRQMNGLPDSHRFIRQGSSGGWRKEMTEAMALRFDKWTEEATTGTGYKVGVSGHKNF